MAHDDAKAKDNVHIVLKDKDGNVKHDSCHNTFGTLGLAAMQDQLLASPSITKPTHMAIGTGTATGTQLGTETSRVALTSKTRSGTVVTMVADWAAGVGTGAITEAGIFSQSSGQDATHPEYAYANFGAINKQAGDSLQITWTITLS